MNFYSIPRHENYSETMDVGVNSTGLVFSLLQHRAHEFNLMESKTC
jgi:hypothetical protein